VEGVALAQVLARRVVVDLVEFFDVVDRLVHEREAVFVRRGRVVVGGVGGGGGGGGRDVFVVPEGPDVGEGWGAHALEHVQFGGFAVDGFAVFDAVAVAVAVAVVVGGCGGGAVFGDCCEAVDLEGWVVGSHSVDGDVGAFFGGLTDSFLDGLNDGAALSDGARLLDVFEFSFLSVDFSKSELSLGSDQVAKLVRVDVEFLSTLDDSRVPVLAEECNVLILIQQLWREQGRLVDVGLEAKGGSEWRQKLVVETIDVLVDGKGVFRQTTTSVLAEQVRHGY